ncbi:hypothetical protein BD770DRAFT_391596 [Pilaira anomala]|nr:hypothetical protein BD770DRAFT_391596 [Pilaira anomala]
MAEVTHYFQKLSLVSFFFFFIALQWYYFSLSCSPGATPYCIIITVSSCIYELNYLLV